MSEIVNFLTAEVSYGETDHLFDNNPGVKHTITVWWIIDTDSGLIKIKEVAIDPDHVEIYEALILEAFYSCR